MKHKYRFLGNRNGIGSWELLNEEVHHLLNVVRLSKGDQFEITDIKGWVGDCEITSKTKSKCEFKLLKESYFDDKRVKLNLYLGALKTSTMESIISPLVEIGVRKIVFFLQPGVEKKRLSEKVFERMRKLAKSALKQCKSPHGTEIVFLDSLQAAISLSAEDSNRIVLVPGANNSIHDVLNINKTGEVSVFIGGEKGWESSELEVFKQENFEKANLGENILRSWTSAVSAAAVTANYLR